MLLLAFPDQSHEYVMKRPQLYVHGENFGKRALDTIETRALKEAAEMLQDIIKRMSYLNQLQK